MLIKFTKMHGLGNDFVVIDAVNQTLELSVDTIKQWADRHRGIGFDQLLLVRRAEGDADFRYVIYNADGSEVSQCGNGARCFALFVRQQGLTNKSIIRVETGAGELTLTVNEQDNVVVNMGQPIFLPAKIPLVSEQEQPLYNVTIDDQEVSFSAVSMGNPHAVIQVTNAETGYINRVGKALESHALFPERANIGFSEVIGRSSLKLRVYERGAGETQACGSGACAAVVAAIELGQVVSPVDVTLLGGHLTVSWEGRGSPVMMSGPATFVFDGMIEL
ncbi:MAG: diaminopimelate epimerase [Cycloclasticus sp.]|nr:diaminopimelate epimerase [Cycloclasticus sp.]